jgi:cell division protein FtsX
VHGNKTYLYIFSCVGVLLMILAAINYMNLATALATTRSKEVGVRKTLGSSRGAVAMQFFTESFVLGLISFLVAIVIVELSLPFFDSSLELRWGLFQRSPSCGGLGFYWCSCLRSYQEVIRHFCFRGSSR